MLLLWTLRPPGWWIHPVKKHVGLFYSHFHVNRPQDLLASWHNFSTTREPNFYFLIHKLCKELVHTNTRAIRNQHNCIHVPALKGPICRIFNIYDIEYSFVSVCYLTVRLLYLKCETNQTLAQSTDFQYNLKPRSLQYLKSWNTEPLKEQHQRRRRVYTWVKDSSPSHVWWSVPVTPVKKTITDPYVRIHGQDFLQEAFL